VKEFHANGYRPAKGLLRLTWPQVEQIDAMVSSLCALTEQNGEGDEARLVLVVKRGKLKYAERPVLSTELRPTRPEASQE
jgi:hypothetical protein